MWSVFLTILCSRRLLKLALGKLGILFLCLFRAIFCLHQIVTSVIFETNHCLHFLQLTISTHKLATQCLPVGHNTQNDLHVPERDWVYRAPSHSLSFGLSQKHIFPHLSHFLCQSHLFYFSLFSGHFHHTIFPPLFCHFIFSVNPPYFQSPFFVISHMLSAPSPTSSLSPTGGLEGSWQL